MVFEEFCYVLSGQQFLGLQLSRELYAGNVCGLFYDVLQDLRRKSIVSTIMDSLSAWRYTDKFLVQQHVLEHFYALAHGYFNQ